MVFMSGMVQWQRGTEPPVALRESYVVVRVEAGVVRGIGLSEDAVEAVDRSFDGGMVEA